MKICNKCKTNTNQFYNPKDGMCKACDKERQRAYYNKNKEVVRAQQKDYYERNKDYNSLRGLIWRLENQEKLRVYRKEYSKAHYEQNKEYYTAKTAKRRAAKSSATPSWLTKEQQEEMLQYYKHAKDCTLTTGEQYHVDHIIPLNGENVCGLHVPWNLQVLPAYVNLSKGSKLLTE